MIYLIAPNVKWGKLWVRDQPGLSLHDVCWLLEPVHVDGVPRGAEVTVIDAGSLDGDRLEVLARAMGAHALGLIELRDVSSADSRPAPAES